MPHVLARKIVEARQLPGGQWIEVVDEGGALQVTIGRTSQRLGDRHQARRRVWRLAAMGERIEVLGLFPVRELLTHQLGDVVRSLEPLDVTELATVRSAVEALVEPRGVAGRGGAEEELAIVAGLLWQAAFPLLGPVVEREVVLDRVPPALDPLLRATSVRAGVRRMFGRPTRPLVRAVAERIAPPDGGPPVFGPLVVAAMGAWACGPERLVEIITTEAGHRAAGRFGEADVDRARHVFGRRPPAQVAEALRVALIDEAGHRRLVEHLAQWSPPQPPPAPRPPERPAAPPRPAEPRRPAPLLQRIEHPPTWREAEGRDVAGLTVVLPHTTDDLRRWGRTLDNCLANYGPAAVSGRSLILGLWEERRLRYVVEVTPGGVIRQIEAPGNHQAAPVLGRQIARELIGLGLAHADGRTGRSFNAPT